MRESRGQHVRFEPLRPAPAGRVIVAVAAGSVLWLVAFAAGAWLLDSTSAIELGLVVTAASFVISVILLGLLRGSRLRRERRYADRG